MKITFQEQQTRTIELPHEAAENVVIKFLQQLISPGEYIREEKRNGKTVKVLKQDDPDHRHGSISEFYVRDATDVDIAALKLISEIRNQQQSGGR